MDHRHMIWCSSALYTTRITRAMNLPQLDDNDGLDDEEECMFWVFLLLISVCIISLVGVAVTHLGALL